MAKTARSDMLAALSVAGFNRKQAASLLGVHETTLWRGMRKNHIKVPRADRKTSPGDLPLMTGLRAAGLSYQGIGEKLGLSRDTVRYNLCKYRTRGG